MILPDVVYGYVAAFPCPGCSDGTGPRVWVHGEWVRAGPVLPKWRRFVALPDADGAACVACGFVYSNVEWFSLRGHFLVESGHLSLN